MPTDINDLNNRILYTAEPVHRNDLPALTDNQAAAFTAQMQTEGRTVPFTMPQRVETQSGPGIETTVARRTGPNSASLATLRNPLAASGNVGQPQVFASATLTAGDLSPQARALLLPPFVPVARTHGLTPPERAAEEVRRLRLDPEAGSASSSSGSEHAPSLSSPNPYPSEIPGAPGPTGPETEEPMVREMQVPTVRARRQDVTDDKRREIHNLRRPDWDNHIMPYGEIAKQAGVSSKTIGKVLREPRPDTPPSGTEGAPAGPARRQDLTDDQKREIHKLREPDADNNILPHYKIAKQVRVGLGTVGKVLREPRPKTPPSGAENAPASKAGYHHATDDQKREIYKLHEPDADNNIMSQDKIAKQVGVSQTTVSSVLRKPRPDTPPPVTEDAPPGPARRRKVTDDDRREIHDAHKPDANNLIPSHEDVASMVGRPKRTVTNVLSQPRPATPVSGAEEE